MKLASLKTAQRDGRLAVISRDLTHAVIAIDIAETLQQALDNWQHVAPLLQERYDLLNAGKLANTLVFADQPVAAPIPRAYQWADGSAYVNHIELVRKARGVPMPENFWHDPLMYQGGSDTLLGAHDDIPLIDESTGLDFESEIAIITHDVALGTTSTEAEKCICLLMLVNDISLRNLIPAELAKGFGFFQSKPSSVFSPVAVTPDELDKAWDGKKVHLPLFTYLNETLFGCPNAGVDMTFDFPTLIAHAAKTRSLGAGTIIGSGTVSNKDKSTGSSCIAEKRMLELMANGKSITPFLSAGDRVRIDMIGADKQSIFGAINQQVVAIKKEQYANTL